MQIDSPQHQDFSGSPLAILLQVVKRTEKQTGTTWAFTARQFAFGGATFVNRVIYIDGSYPSYPDELFDLNLKVAHDRRYDPASLTAGSIVEFIITSGILVSGSTNRTYGNFAIQDNEMFMTLNRRYQFNDGGSGAGLGAVTIIDLS